MDRSTRLATVEDADVGHDLRYLRNAEVALGRFESANRTAERLERIAVAVDDTELKLRSDLIRIIHGRVEGDDKAASVRAIGERVLAEAERANLSGVQSAALIQLGLAELLDGRPMEEFRLLERAEAVALRDPDQMAVRVVRHYIANRLPRLAMPISEIEARLRQQMDLASNPEDRGQLLLGLAYVAAASDRREEARALYTEARQMTEEVGLRMFVVESWAALVADIEVLCDAPDRAEEILRGTYDEMRGMGDSWVLAQYAPALAWTIALQTDRMTDARADEVEELVRIGRDAGEHGLDMPVPWADQALALALSWQGRHADAVRLAEASANSTATESASPDDAALALLTLAIVRRAAGDTDGARVAADRSAALSASKGLRPWQRKAEAIAAQLA